MIDFPGSFSRMYRVSTCRNSFCFISYSLSSFSWRSWEGQVRKSSFGIIYKFPKFPSTYYCSKYSLFSLSIYIHACIYICYICIHFCISSYTLFCNIIFPQICIIQLYTFFRSTFFSDMDIQLSTLFYTSSTYAETSNYIIARKGFYFSCAWKLEWMGLADVCRIGTLKFSALVLCRKCTKFYAWHFQP